MYSQDMNLAMKSIFVIRFRMSPSDCWKHQRFPVDVMFSDIWIQDCWKHQCFLLDVMFSIIWIRMKHSNGGLSLKRNVSLTCCLACYVIWYASERGITMHDNGICEYVVTV